MICKGCQKRHIGCHSKCEDYQKEKEKRDAVNKKVRAERLKDTVLTWQEIERIERGRKKKGVIK